MEKLEKMRNLQNKENQKLAKLLESATGVLKPCYMLLRGNGTVPDNIIKKYKQFMRELQGIEGVSWQDNQTEQWAMTYENGHTLNTTFTETSGNITVTNPPRTKRKHTEEEPVLDSTFVLAAKESLKNSANVCADQLLTKGGLLHSYVSAVACDMLHGAFVIVDMLRGKT